MICDKYREKNTRPQFVKRNWLHSVMNSLRNGTDYQPNILKISDAVLKYFAYMFLCRPEDGYINPAETCRRVFC
jgi:hypothetical protein